MGILDNFEKGLERAVNGAFAKTFKSGLQPVEITADLRKELDTKAVVVSRDRILVPNKFTVRLSPTDFGRMEELGETLIEELTELVESHGSEQNYYFAGPVSIRLSEDKHLAVGMVQIDSENVKGSVSWVPILDIDGEPYQLSGSRTVVGRGRNSDITIHDTGASRQHAEIQWDGKQAQVKDLGSTNGTFVNGRRIRQAVLDPESVIEIGRTRLTLRIVPRNSSEIQGNAALNDRNNRGKS